MTAPDRIWIDPNRPNPYYFLDSDQEYMKEIEYIRLGAFPVEDLKCMHREMIAEGVYGWSNTIGDILTLLEQEE